MKNILLLLICALSFSLAAAPGFAGKKGEKTEQEYDSGELDSLDDTSSRHWKEGTGKTDDDGAVKKVKKPAKKGACPEGQAKDLDGVCK